MKSDQPAVVAGIVAYNTEIDTLAATVRSLLNSSIKLTTVVLCNSGSATYQASVKQLAEKFNVKFIGNQPNRGFGAGHNAIVCDSDATWYVCCNPDIEIQENTIEKMLTGVAGCSEVGLVGPKIINPLGNIQQTARKHITLRNWTHRQLWRLFPSFFAPFESKFDYNKTQPVEFLSGAFFMVKFDVMRKLGGFDEDFFLYCEDADLSKRAETFGPNYYVADAIVYHKWSQAWASSVKGFYWAILALLKYQLKHRL